MSRLFAGAISLFLACSAQAAALSGTQSIGPTGDFTSIGAAISAIQTNGLSGPLILELQAAYVSSVEAFPLTFSNLGTTPSNTVTLRPTTGATNLTITSGDTTATVDLNGAQFVNIDGRPGGTGGAKELTIANTDNAGVALRFINEGSLNRVSHAVLRGVNASASSGVVLFSTTTGANGNDDNVIDTCDIRDGVMTPANGVYSLGSSGSSAKFNSGNVVSNCSVFNFYAGTAVDSAGLRLEAGSTDWTITGNSFYQTVSRPAVTANVCGIFINNSSGNNFSVTANFFGGSAPNAGGAAWTTTGTGAAYLFQGIRFYVGSATPSNVQGNTIQNIVWTSSSSTFARPGVWAGIYVGTGSVNIGTTTGNTIGSGTGTDSVVVTSSGTGGKSYGIAVDSGDTVSISNNTIGSITTNGTGTTVSASFVGIAVIYGTFTIANNMVGSATTPNSINAANSSTSVSGQELTGILCAGNDWASITGNTVANMNNNYAGTSSTGLVRGIHIYSEVNFVVGNIVRNLSTMSRNSNTTNAQSAIGISLDSIRLNCIVSQNIVHSLANTTPSAAVCVTGIYFDGARPVIARNLVHSLVISSSSTLSRLSGMHFKSGEFSAQNNMVHVGLDASGASTAGTSNVRGIFDEGATDGRNFYHNSVFVGGTQTDGAASSFAFDGATGTTNARAYQNNVFVNARSNSGGTGKHYAVRYGGATAPFPGLVAGGNIFFVTGVGGVVGFSNGDRATLAAWQVATGQDSSSAVVDPLFISPTGTSATLDLHLQASNPAEGGGVPLTDARTRALVALSDDFDGETRGTLTPLDIGADAANFTPSVSDIYAPVITYPLLSDRSNANRELSDWVTITDGTGVSTGISAPRLYFKRAVDADVFGGNTAADDGWKYVAAAGSGPFSLTLDYSIIHGGSVVPGDVIQYFVVAQDTANNLASSPAGTTSSASPPVPGVNGHGAVNSFSIIPAISGAKTVGNGGDYPSLSGVNGLFAALAAGVVTGNVVVSITSDVTETGSVALTQWREEGEGNYTLSIQPDSATMRIISGSAVASLIAFDGVSRVNIDGRFGVSGRYLTFRNESITVFASAFLFVNDASHNTVRNCVVEGAGFYEGVIAFGHGATVGNNNNLITSCQVRDLSTGNGVPGMLISSSSRKFGPPNAQNTLSDNELFNFAHAGIAITFSPGSPTGNASWTISDNNVYQLNASASSVVGISIAGDGLGGDNVIVGNWIHDLLTTSTQSTGIGLGNVSGGYDVSGAVVTITGNRITAINVNPATRNVTGISIGAAFYPRLNLVNNQITLSPSSPGNQAIVGLSDRGGQQVNVFHNSIVVGGVESGASSSSAVSCDPMGFTARNNLFMNFRSGGTGSHVAGGYGNIQGDTGGFISTHNVYAGTGATASNFMAYYGTKMSLAAWQTVTGATNSQGGIAGTGYFTTAIFVDAASGDLHLAPGGNPLVNAAGIPIAGITDDFDGDLRSLTAPTIGSDEAVALVGIASWRQTHFGVSTNSGNAADGFDFDNDGLPNLIEWACGLNPIIASTLPASAVRNGANLEFSYTRSVTALNAGTGFAVEWSDTLSNDWESTGVSESILSDNGTVQEVKVTLPIGSAGRRFVHLKVTAAP